MKKSRSLGRRGRLPLVVGRTRILTRDGVFVVSEIAAQAVTLTSGTGETITVSYADLGEVEARDEDGHRYAVHTALLPEWDALSEANKQVVLERLEVVLEILTGYRYGSPALARHGEPQAVFDPGRSLKARCESMARVLQVEREGDRILQRRIAAGELQRRSPSFSTIRKWVSDFLADGVMGVADGRARRGKATFAAVDADFRRLVEAEVGVFNGDVSQVSVKEVLRRVKVAAKQEGLELTGQQRLRTAYVSWLLRDRGNGTRAQRSRSMRDTAGYAHYPAERPGQVISIDATRSDVMVWDDLYEHQFSVEILTAMDVATRCVLALRVVPKSASSVDAGLLVYDVMRPFVMHVDGAEVTEWRWPCIPESVRFQCDHSRCDTDSSNSSDENGSSSADSDASTVNPSLQGSHRIPGLKPTAIRCDHGSIFVGSYFTRLLNDLGIDLMLSRGTRPTDNPHVERYHETLQQVLQQFTGYKGRSPFERGRTVGKNAEPGEDEPKRTARDLERYLRTWIVTEYHRNWHEGLVHPGVEDARNTPIGLFEDLVKITGRIDVPQRPDLVYSFLPVRWHPIRHDGVEIKNMTYDDPILDDFRGAPPGTFRPQDNKAPFFYDPRDVSRIWFRDPHTRQVHPITWRGAWKVDAPLTDKVVDYIRERVHARGGNRALQKGSATAQIIDEFEELSQTRQSRADKAMWLAAEVRVHASQRDHLEAQLAQYSQSRSEAPDDSDSRADGSTGTGLRLVSPGSSDQESGAGPNKSDPWAELEASTSADNDDSDTTPAATTVSRLVWPPPITATADNDDDIWGEL